MYFGHAAPFTSPVGLKSVNGTNGFSIKNNSSNFLIPVGTLGDINGDGIDDFFSGNNIIFGSSNPGAFTNNLTVNGTNGFGLTGYTQTSAAIGDINRDGIDDFIVVASSENWIIFGSTQTSPSTFDATTLDGTNGFKIKNLRHSNVGRQVSGNADVNGDGFPDFMLSSSGQGTGSFNTGEHGFVYVVFSGDHFAKPLTTGYPKAVNISYTSFELQVNAAEKGKVYYAVYPGTQSAITTTSTIVSGTGALQHGEISINQISTNANKALTGLSENTKYDVYVYFEDEAGNKGQIYKLDDVTTLVRPSDNLPPVITCPENKTLGCGALPNYVTTISVTDNEDASPTVVQFPAAGTVINSNTVVTITATDNANNTSTCTFTVVLSNSIACPGNQITNATSFALSDYTQGRVVTGFCSGAPVITQTPAPGTIITNDVVVTLTATAGNVTATCSFEITVTGGTTAIESATDVNFIVYPNPAKDMVYIKGGNYDSFEIIDNLGSLVLQGGNDAEINISTLAHGMYVILFYNSNQQVVEMKKVVKN